MLNLLSAMFYRIETRDDSPLLRIVMRDFWTMTTFDAYMRDCGTAIERLIARHGRFDTLGDCNDFPIQGPDVAAAFEHLGQMTDKTPQNRIAIVTGKALGRMQADRLVGNPHSKTFRTEASALEWLGYVEPPATGHMLSTIVEFPPSRRAG